ncbi:MAG: extracellular solute-binding protein [Cephaloticoccus sp.]|nr:extracellular solute-binding protein [Cephaloticoccus sp.]
MLRYFSPGVWFVIFLATISSAIVLLLPVAPRPGMIFWVFDRNHATISRVIAEEWNEKHPTTPVQVTLLTGAALGSRMLTAFYSDTPVGDLIEVERSLIGQVFAGPIDDIGFVDLTDRLQSEHVDDVINTPSFSPWTSRGHIFGLPHDVHPVMLLYRSDLVEEAGIDVTQIETWDDYFRIMRPLMRDLDGDGRIDRFLLNAAPTSLQFHEVFLLQAGGGYFDAAGRPTVNSEINIRILSHLATWYAGPARVASEVPPTAIAAQLITDGYVVGFLAPDWYAGSIRKSLPGMAGRFKLMPLPAWEKGGRRTSVYGGTMLGITKASHYRDEAWEFAKQLYLSPETAKRLYDVTRIITPIKSNWSETCYDEPDPFYSNQPVGRMYINLAPEVPLRPSSPFYGNAQQVLNIAIIDLSRYADEHGISDPADLADESRRLLNRAQSLLITQMQRNVFLKAGAP